jgi:hypothetical protein
MMPAQTKSYEGGHIRTRPIFIEFCLRRSFEENKNVTVISTEYFDTKEYGAYKEDIKTTAKERSNILFL